MYVDKVLVLNSGSISDLQIEFEFFESGDPKPLVVVGRNGAGKTNLLSILTDALVEFAVKSFEDIVPISPGGGHQYYRMLGGVNIRSGSNFEFAAVEFMDAQNRYGFSSKVGDLRKADIASHIASFAELGDWPEGGAHKAVNADKDDAERIFRDGCYVSFPSNRAELPHWLAAMTPNEDANFAAGYSNRLGKPITVNRAVPDLKPWLVNVLLDQMIDAVELGPLIGNPGQMVQLIASRIHQTVSLTNFNNLLRITLDCPNARLIRVGRFANDRKLQVFDGNQPLLPSLDSFSAGQATLISIFSTILRYADSNACPTNEMKGIVIVDEIDAHLHADLQYEVLPKLMKLFPKIQFIVTAHAPLFPLGMEREYGEGGFQMIELPDGKKVAAERYSEFLSSFEMLKETKAFDDAVTNKISEAELPLLLCEGETDPKYLRTAAELLGFNRISTEANVDWVGSISNGQARDGGEGQLRQVRRTLQNNPVFLKNHTLLLFDCDVNDPPLDNGYLHVRVLPTNDNNTECDRGIENLLPETVFEDRFFSETRHQNGANTTITRNLNKASLCNYLCDEKRDAADFEGFRASLETIEAALWPPAMG